MTAAPPHGRLRTLTASAVIGTDRAGGGTDAAPRLLSEVALLGAQARAGLCVASGLQAVEPPPPDARPVAHDRPQASLLRLLADPDAGLIEEWATLANERGVRIADATVPLVLDWWARQPQRSEAVFIACGKVGEWLAGLNRIWRKPVAAADIPPDADEIWQTGKAAERAALLTTVRRVDPARALALIRSTWSADSADERSRFVTVLFHRSSIADEPFLEAALDDKSKSVRSVAAGVLRFIPGSRLRQRMRERARSIVGTEKKGLLKRGVRLTISPPQQFDKAWERDGIVEEAASGRGKRAWWTRQILESTGLDVWTEVSGLAPESTLEALSGDDFADEAIEAMAVQASASTDRAWCFALADALTERPKIPWTRYSPLWQNLPKPDREALALRAADRIKAGPEDRWQLIAAVQGAWSPEFSRAAMELMVRHAPKRTRDTWQHWHAIEEASRHLHPSAADEFEKAVASVVSDDPTPSIKRSIDRVRLRADMHKEFTS